MPVSMKEEIEGFLFHCEYEKNLSTKTLKAYSIDLNQFSRFLHTQNEVYTHAADINKEVLKTYVVHLNKVYAIKSVKRKIATLKALFNYLEFDDKITVNPFRKIRLQLKEPFRLPSVLDLTEVQAIFRTIYTRKRRIANKHSYAYKTTLRDIAIIELLFATGIRVGELCSLSVSNINLEQGFIKVHGKGSKERIIQLCHHELLHSLRTYKQLRNSTNPYFFLNRLEKPISEQSVRFMVKRYVAQANITKSITPHSFRHTFATMLLEEDVDIKYIQNIFGHSSIVTTQIYTHVNNKKQKEILALKHPRNRLKVVS